MVDKKKNKLEVNDRLKEIDKMVDKLIPNDYINKLIKKYSSELENYKYIETVGDFSLLPLKGSMRYINKYDKELRFGGLLIKIYQKNNQWYTILMKSDGKKYYVSFNSNYIFYCKNPGEIYYNNLNNNLNMFITDVENNKYEII